MSSRTLSWLLLLLFSSIGTSAYAQTVSVEDRNPLGTAGFEQVGVSSSESAVPSRSGTDHFSSRELDMLSDGNWIWGLLTESVLSRGTTYAISDVSLRSTYYVGGAGFLAVSHDSGASWSEKLSFQHVYNGLDDDSDEEMGELSDADRGRMAERRREVIRQEIVDKFGSEDFADSILDDITDSDLVDAQDISDIEELEVLDLDMDPNLNHILLNDNAGSGTDDFLSEHDRYIDRYLSLVRRGSDPEIAVMVASDSAAVWQIVSMPAATFVVTSDAVFMSTDHGEQWQPFIFRSDEMAYLSIAVSSDAQVVVVGTTDGLLVTQDGGENWVTTNDGMKGGIFDVKIASNNSWALAVSTEHLYESPDHGMNWYEMLTPLSDNETIIDVELGGSNQMLVLTTENLYFVDNGEWTEVGYRPFGEENLREIVAKDSSLTSFVVRTDQHVFEFSGGWKDQSKALFASDLGTFNYLGDGVSLGILASSSGLWLAQDLSVIENRPEYRALKEKWEREPSDAMVLEQALESHYLGSVLDTRWGLRSCLAWLLPRVDFEYLFRQDRWDYHKTVTNFATGIEESDVWTSKRQTRHEWQIMAHWDIQIDKANTDSVARESTLAGLRDDRFALVKKVNNELNKRHALEMTLVLDLPKLPEAAAASKQKNLLKRQIKAQLDLAEAESHLNYLTGGYYLPAINQHKP